MANYPDIEAVCAECKTTYPAGQWRRDDPLTADEREDIIEASDPGCAGYDYGEIETPHLRGGWGTGCALCGSPNVLLRAELEDSDEAV